MRNILAVASLVLFSLPAAADEAVPATEGIKWSGSANWRYTFTKNDDNLQSQSSNAGGPPQDVSSLKTQAHQIRANLGATAKWGHAEWGMGLRTTSAANSDWVNMQGGADRAFGLEQGWGRYLGEAGELRWSVTVGRQKIGFAYDRQSQNFLSNDVRWDGAEEEIKWGAVGLNLAQFVTGALSQGTNGTSTYSKTDASDAAANTQSHMNTVFAFQPYANLRITDEIKTLLAVGYYQWTDSSITNRTGGNFNNATGGNGAAAGGSVPAVNSALFTVANLRQWQILSAWNLPRGWSVSGELVINKQNQFSTASVAGYSANAANQNVYSKAWTVGIKYGGDVKRAGDWAVAYNYGKKGLASVVGNYTYIKWQPDNQGHLLQAQYVLADRLVLTAKAMFLQEIEKKVPTTGLAYAGANASQELDTSYFELNGGVSF